MSKADFGGHQLVTVIESAHMHQHRYHDIMMLGQGENRVLQVDDNLHFTG